MTGFTIVDPVSSSQTIQESTAEMLNAKLAALLGWTNLIKVSGLLVGTPPNTDSRASCPVPNWTNDWYYCGPLMVEHSCFPEEKAIHLKDGTTAQTFICVPYSNECFYVIDFATKDFAVREAIVHGVIQKLSGYPLKETS
jgi:hypothetical protein